VESTAPRRACLGDGVSFAKCIQRNQQPHVMPQIRQVGCSVSEALLDADHRVAQRHGCASVERR
jgi:hypothetical protein